MEELQNLNDLKGGFNKHWPLKDKLSYNLLQDYLEKISFSIQDLNDTIRPDGKYTVKDIIYIITLAKWTRQAMYGIKCLYKPDILKNFSYTKDIELERGYNFMLTIESIAQGHPLNTERHDDYGFDGDIICADICSSLTPILSLYQDCSFRHIAPDGMHNGKNPYSDFYLRVYSKKKNQALYSSFIGVSTEDILDIIRLYIDKIYAFDKYLKSMKNSCKK